MAIDQLLLKLKACEEAKDWAQGKSWQEIFTTCHRGDWLLWLFAKISINNDDDLNLMIKTKAYCALTVKHLMKDSRSINACEIAIKFADGLVTIEELNNHAAAAAACNYDAAAAAAAAYASDAAYVAAGDAAGAAAYEKIKNQLETADICRKYLPIEVWNIVED